MPHEATVGLRTKAWLEFQSGPLAGTRFPILPGVTRIGRAADNDIVIAGEGSSTVSLHHCEIHQNGEGFELRDLNSTNGTWVNGSAIAAAAISPTAAIRLGIRGPEFQLVYEDSAALPPDRTMELLPDQVPGGKDASSAHEGLLSAAVHRARRLRRRGVHGQTMSIMRGVIEQALRRTRRRFRTIGILLLAALAAVSALAIWKIAALRSRQRAIDSHIQTIERALERAGAGTDIDALLTQLGKYQDQAESLRRTLLYRLSGQSSGGDFVTAQLHSVMAEFGAEAYSIPPDFVDRVKYYIRQDQGPNRPLIAHALKQAHGQLETIRQILRGEELPPDLAYIPLVESALETGRASAAGAAGPWQFTAATARVYGLRVDGQVDQRQNLVASTGAACKYLRSLILDFGAGSSVMLALAAYDGGTSTVKQAVNRTVRDPIKQRNFWYLYRVRALPPETREYVPRVFAAILIGRNPRYFGF